MINDAFFFNSDIRQINCCSNSEDETDYYQQIVMFTDTIRKFFILWEHYLVTKYFVKQDSNKIL